MVEKLGFNCINIHRSSIANWNRFLRPDVSFTFLAQLLNDPRETLETLAARPYLDDATTQGQRIWIFLDPRSGEINVLIAMERW